MKKAKFVITLYSPNEEYLRKRLVDAGFLPYSIERATKTKKEKLIDFLKPILAENDGYTYEQIAVAVLKQNKINKNVLLDNVVLNKKKKEFVKVVDVFEMVSVKRVCELAGL